MTIAELIQELQRHNPSWEVLVTQETGVALKLGQPTPHLFYDHPDSQEVYKLTLHGVWPASDEEGWRCPDCRRCLAPRVIECPCSEHKREHPEFYQRKEPS